MFDPYCSQNNEIFFNISDCVPPNQLLGDQIIPSLEQHNDLDNLLNQIPTLVEDPNRSKRPLASKLTSIDHDQGNDDLNPNDIKKRQKIIHREIERKRRLEMSSLHASLKSLLPLECIKGKRSMSDHLGEAEKYIKQMQQKLQVLNDKRDDLRKEMSNYKRIEYENDVKVNVFKGSIEVIVCTKEDDGLPLSKVLQCLDQQGFDVVNSISKKVNANFVHSVHAQVSTYFVRLYSLHLV
ncbi:hypothetical protein SOVF_039500 [Spinacia oleracea]|nr:hypothetical protein SOVF_039500 [Spinacia oleracea]